MLTLVADTLNAHDEIRTSFSFDPASSPEVWTMMICRLERIEALVMQHMLAICEFALRANLLAESTPQAHKAEYVGSKERGVSASTYFLECQKEMMMETKCTVSCEVWRWGLVTKLALNS